MGWFDSKKPSSVEMLGQGVSRMAQQTINGHEVKSFEQHLKETLEARKSGGASAVAETLQPYQDADKWPQFPVELPAPLKLAVKKKAYEVDDDEDEDDDNAGGCCNCCGCCSIACKCGPRTLLYGLSCVMMMCCMQGLILRKAVGFLLKRKWQSKVEDGIDLQTHIEALHFLYLCDNAGSIASTSALNAATGKPVKKKKLHQVTIQDKKFIIYNTGQLEEF